MEMAYRGQQLQQLADLQAAHPTSADLAPLQQLCTQLLSDRSSGTAVLSVLL